MFPPFLFKLITLITYLLSRTLVLFCPWLGLAYLSLHLTLPRWWLLNSGSSFGSDRPRDLHPPPVLSFITLITYLLSLTLVLSCPWLGLAYLSLHLTLPWWWLINIRDSVFSIFFVLCTNHFIGSVCQTKKKIWFFEISPSGSYLSLFTFLSSAAL